MRITEAHRKKLCELVDFAFVEMGQLGWAGKSGQAADLAYAFHNLPKDMRKEDVSLEFFRDPFLAAYQEKYPDGRIGEYVAVVSETVTEGGDCAEN